MNSAGLSWFPMRATYSRELIIKDELDRLGVENFVPMKDNWVKNGVGEELRQEPAIHNLIFVHSTQEKISELKRSYKRLEPLRYMTRPSVDSREHTIIRIPDAQMSAFLRLASFHYDDRIVFFDNMQFVSKPGPRVEIIEGDFAGVRGEVKRIKGYRCVAVSVEGIAAVGIMDMPNKCLRYLDVRKERAAS
jgi:transcription antitermination factor NusG